MAMNHLFQEVKNSRKSQSTLSTLYNSWKNGKLKIDEYQRNYVDRKSKWNTKLVESQLSGVSLGEIIIVKVISEDGLDTVKYIVDGQHRVQTLMRFMNGEIKLTARHQDFTDDSLSNKLWDQLPSSIQTAFEDTELSVYSFEEDGKFSADEIFLIMNQGGSKISKLDTFHAQHYSEESYKEIFSFANNPVWKGYSPAGQLRRHHIRRLIQHIMDYNYYKSSGQYNKNNNELAFYKETITTMSANKLKKELTEVRKFVELYDTISGLGDKLTDGKSARYDIFTNIVLRSLLEKYSHSALIGKSAEIRVFWDNWFATNETVFQDSAKDSRRSYVIPATFNPIMKQFVEELEKSIQLLPVLPGVTSSQRKNMIQDSLDENGKVTDSITGSKLNPVMVDVGHKVARADGGDTSPSNLELQHKTINRSRRV